MNKKIFGLSITTLCVLVKALVIISALCSCNAFSGFGEYTENNPNAFHAVELNASNMHRLNFGTSANKAPSNKTTIEPDGSITLYANNSTSSAGKIAGSEDGITFYFKEVDANMNFSLSAEVEVKFFGLQNGRTELNGQEGFGLMARDYVPQYPGYTMEELRGVEADGEYYAGSTGGTGNMIMVGGVKRGARVYWRTGVTDPTGECITDNDPGKIADASKAVFDFTPRELPDYSPYPTMNDRPDFPSAGSKYSLTLEKTNSGFNAVILQTVRGAGGGGGYAGQRFDYFIPEPDLLTAINKDHYYIGFFAARSAEITVRNISYSEANVDDCAPRVIPDSVLIEPSLNIYSPSASASSDYTLVARSNVEGTLAVSLNGTALPEEAGRGEWMVEKSNAVSVPFTQFTVPASGLRDGDNVFRLMFYPDNNQSQSQYLLSSTTPLSLSFIVNKKTMGDAEGNIWVSPTGRASNAGTRDNPVDLDTGIAYVQAGKSVIMQDGVYTPLAVSIPRYNNGSEGNLKTLKAEHRDKAIIDFQGNPQNKGFELRGDYWKISGIHVRGTAPVKRKGLTVMGHHNVVEWVKTYNNGDTGLQISGESAEPKALWPSHNTISFCESFNNKDEAREDADGFAAKLTVGNGNTFTWCVAHHNCDDGWDLFTKKETGAIGAVTVEYCIAYSNGYYFNADGSGEAVFAASGGNGFKMGGEGIAVKHTIVNSLAFLNGADGFTSNSNPALILTNCTAYENAGRGYAIYGSGTSAPEGLDAKVTRVLSMYSADSGEHSNDGVWWDTTLTAVGYVWRNNASRNKSESVITVERNIVSAALPLADAAPFDPSIRGTFIERHDDGSFVLNGFMKTKNINGTQPGAVGLHTADETAL
ncbi:MAG: right-handed parallel beta-helix repeat-containing protein [Treponema sp.]|nr:right-handed parallel beta-helix repeat-containing protein [Treponema sp.]